MIFRLLRATPVLFGALLAACGSPAASKTADDAGSDLSPVPPLPDDVSGVDFTRLREELGQREDFGARCEDDRPLKQWLTWLDAGSWAELLESAERWTEHCPIDIDAHFMAGVSHDKLGNVPAAKRRLDCVKGLIDSIGASGDGRTAATAFRVVSIPEEYSFLRIVGLEPKSQAYDGGTVDEFVVERKGKQAKVFFDATPHFKRMKKKFGLEL